MPLFGEELYPEKDVNLDDYLSAVKNNRDSFKSLSPTTLSELRNDSSFYEEAKPFLNYLYGDDERPDVIEKLRNEDYKILDLYTVGNAMKDAPEEVLESYRRTRQRFDSVDVETVSEFIRAAKEIGTDIVTDPVNLAFIAAAPFTFGAGSAVARGVTQAAAKQAGKALVKEAVKETGDTAYKRILTEGTIGFVEGSSFGALENYYTQSRDIAVKLQDTTEVDKNIVLGTALGTGVLGAGAAVGIGAALNKLRSSRNNLVNNEELSSLENSSNPNTLNSKDFNDHTGSMDEDVEDLIDGIFEGKQIRDLPGLPARISDTFEAEWEDVTDIVESFASKKGLSADGTAALKEKLEIEFKKKTTTRTGIISALSNIVDKSFALPAYYGGRISSLLDPHAKKSKTIKELQKRFRYDSNRAWVGERETEFSDYSESFNSIFGDYHVRMKYALDPILKVTTGKARDEAYVSLIKAIRGEASKDDIINAAALTIRKDLDSIAKRLRDNKLLGLSKQIENYFPRVWNRDAIKNNQDDFINLLVKAGEAKNYGEGRDIWREMLEKQNQYGDTPGTGATFLAKRQFTKLKDSDFTKFLDTNPQNVLNAYYAQASRQLARKRMFGASSWEKFRKKYRKRIYNELGDVQGLKAMKDLQTVWRQQTGEGAAESNLAIDSISSFQRFSLLPLATLSSITELFINMNRGGFVNTIKNFGKASKAAKDAVTYNVVNGLKNDHNLSTPEAFRHMQRFGIALDLAATDQVDRLSGEMIGNKTLARGNQLFFRYGTLLEPWTKLVQLTSFNVGRDIITDNLKAVEKFRTLGKDPSARIQRKIDELKELNVDVEVGLDWLKRTQGDMTIKDPFNYIVDRGAARYTNEIVLNTSREAGLKSLALTANPFTSLLFQLSAYPAAFTNTVLKDMVRRVARTSLNGDITGATKIVGAALTLQGVANFTNYARNAAFTQNPEFEDKSFWESQRDALGRWGGQGLMLDIYSRMQQTEEYYGPTIAAGAAFGPTASDVAITLRTDDYGRMGAKLIPYYNAMSQETRKDIRGFFRDLFKPEPSLRSFSKGGEVAIDRAAKEPDERIDKMTGVPYDQQAGTAFVDVEDPLRRLGFGKGGEVDPLERLGLVIGGFVARGIKKFLSPEEEISEIIKTYSKAPVSARDAEKSAKEILAPHTDDVDMPSEFDDPVVFKFIKLETKALLEEKNDLSLPELQEKFPEHFKDGVLQPGTEFSIARGYTDDEIETFQEANEVGSEISNRADITYNISNVLKENKLVEENISDAEWDTRSNSVPEEGIDDVEDIKKYLDLPDKSVAERQADADALNFDPTIYYHGTGANIRNVRKGTFFSKDPKVSTAYAVSRPYSEPDGGASLYPVRLNKTDYIQITPDEDTRWEEIHLPTAKVTYKGKEWGNAKEWLQKRGIKFRALEDNMTDTDSLVEMIAVGLNLKKKPKGVIINKLWDKPESPIEVQLILKDWLKENYNIDYVVNAEIESLDIESGILDHVVVASDRGEMDLIDLDILNEGIYLAREAAELDDKPGDVVIAIDPSTVRSVNARFDPENKDSSRILATQGGKVLKALKNKRLGFREGSKADDPSMYRSDGSKKSDKGFLGPIEAEDGRTMTEFSIGVKINGQETEIPSLVPGLTKDEIVSLKEGNVPKSVAVKARNHALKRLDEGKSVFYQDGED